MSRPRHRAEDGAKPHRLLLGTPNNLVQWEYATASDARDRIKVYLTEIENFGTKHNPDLLVAVQNTRRDILNADFPTDVSNPLTPRVAPVHAKSWEFTDQPTGLTWVVKLWKEK